MNRNVFVALLWLAVSANVPVLQAADHLILNSRLDCASDSQDGPLITGTNLQDGVVAGKPNYVIIFGEGCLNSKQQARRTVELYQKYQGRVNFVVVDLDVKRTAEQQELVQRYYTGSIPHVVVLDKEGQPLYNAAG
jgi:thioredoxin-like negative regulator of GroEL